MDLTSIQDKNIKTHLNLVKSSLQQQDHVFSQAQYHTKCTVNGSFEFNGKKGF